MPKSDREDIAELLTEQNFNSRFEGEAEEPPASFSERFPPMADTSRAPIQGPADEYPPGFRRGEHMGGMLDQMAEPLYPPEFKRGEYMGGMLDHPPPDTSIGPMPREPLPKWVGKYGPPSYPGETRRKR